MVYVYTAAVAACSAGKSAGRQFAVVFPQHQPTIAAAPAGARLYVTSCSWYPVHVLISLPRHVTGLLWPPSEAPVFTSRSYRLMNNGQSVELELPSPVHLHGTNVENKGQRSVYSKSGLPLIEVKYLGYYWPACVVCSAHIVKLTL